MALRETLDWQRWFIRQLVIGAAFGWMGPFGTFVALGLQQRLIFWISNTLLIGLCARLCIRAIGRLPVAAHLGLTQRIAAGALLAAVPGTLLVMTMLALFGSRPPWSLAALAETYASICAFVMLVGLPMALLARRPAMTDTATPPSPVPQPAAFLRRLSPRLGTELLHLEAEDHYVRVATRLGEELLLCRLSDAIEELPDELGRRVHRSHWVARAAIAGSEKKNGKIELRLINGTLVPVSDTYLPSLRQAGWLEHQGDGFHR